MISSTAPKHSNLDAGLSAFPPTPRTTSDPDYKGDLESTTLLPHNVTNHFQKYKYQAQHGSRVESAEKRSTVSW